jgi:response regulator RpfG family c-di-GMP phosphodiesterase
MKLHSEIRVLYVDDEQLNLNAFKVNFRKNFNVLVASDATEALEIINSTPIDVVVTDHMMPNITGVDLLEMLRTSHPYIGRILITGCNDINIVIEAINRCDVFRFLTKPWVKDDLTQTIEKSYEASVEIQKEFESTSKLAETNQQLEFMLRQKLIS